jgi:hypothetical protein
MFRMFQFEPLGEMSNVLDWRGRGTDVAVLSAHLVDAGDVRYYCAGVPNLDGA